MCTLVHITNEHHG